MADPDIRLLAALDDDPDDPAPVWTNLSPWLHYGDGGGEVSVTIGRQDETGETRPTELSWALDNGDNRFTPRNPTSPYAGRWEQGRRVQLVEVVDGEEFPLGTGFLEIPEMAVVDPRSSQPVTVTAIDRMGRLDSAPAYAGTLAEHVRTHGGTLVEHWPLTEQAVNGEYMSTITGATTRRSAQGWGRAPIAVDLDDLIRPATAAGPPGDDQSYAQWSLVGDKDGLASWADAHLEAPLFLAVSTTDTIALSAWVQLGTYDLASGSEEPNANIAILARQIPGPDYRRLSLDRQGIDVPGAPDRYEVTARLAAGTGSMVSLAVADRDYGRDAWRLVTTRVTLATGLWELWVGADGVASTTATIPPGVIVFDTALLGYFYSGALGHVQVRVGPAATTMTRADHLAQYEHGYRGLHRQTVAERIVTLAGYAGVPASEVVVPAECSTPLQAARLAGQSPAAAMRAAATSGQDTLITDGLGRITAVPRSRRYNQPIAMQIPFGWIGYRSLKYRPDRPITDVTVSRAGGGQVRRTDVARARRYGVAAMSVQLESDIDADAGNLASWLLAAHGQQRTRCPSLRINMLSSRLTLADRKALLKLRVGDRIEITDMPPGSPEDVPHLIIQGIKHTIGPGRRRLIDFNTSPLLGPTVGQPPACPMVGDLVSTTAVIAY